jgi:GNAT superfamily N-acetyltransferase
VEAPSATCPPFAVRTYGAARTSSPLDDLYVREQYRDAGVGRALMLELTRYALPERLAITWGMRPDNHDAQRFYTRLGARLRPKIVAQWDATTYSRSFDD